jgi:hypothetical protein
MRRPRCRTSGTVRRCRVEFFTHITGTFSRGSCCALLCSVVLRRRHHCRRSYPRHEPRSRSLARARVCWFLSIVHFFCFFTELAAMCCVMPRRSETPRTVQPVFKNSMGPKNSEVSESVTFYKIQKKFSKIQKNSTEMSERNRNFLKTQKSTDNSAE